MQEKHKFLVMSKKLDNQERGIFRRGFVAEVEQGGAKPRKTRAGVLRYFGRPRAVPTAHPAALRAYGRPKTRKTRVWRCYRLYLISPPPLPPAPSPAPPGAWGGGVSPLTRARPPPRRFFRPTSRAEMRRPDRAQGGAAWRGARATTRRAPRQTGAVHIGAGR